MGSALDELIPPRPDHAVRKTLTVVRKWMDVSFEITTDPTMLLDRTIVEMLTDAELQGVKKHLQSFVNIEAAQRRLALGVCQALLLADSPHSHALLACPRIELGEVERVLGGRDNAVSWAAFHFGVAAGLAGPLPSATTAERYVLSTFLAGRSSLPAFPPGLALGLSLRGVALPWGTLFGLMTRGQFPLGEGEEAKDFAVQSDVAAISSLLAIGVAGMGRGELAATALSVLSSHIPSLAYPQVLGKAFTCPRQIAAIVALGLVHMLKPARAYVAALAVELVAWRGGFSNETPSDIGVLPESAPTSTDFAHTEIRALCAGAAIGMMLMGMGSADGHVPAVDAFPLLALLALTLRRNEVDPQTRMAAAASPMKPHLMRPTQLFKYVDGAEKLPEAHSERSFGPFDEFLRPRRRAAHTAAPAGLPAKVSLTCIEGVFIDRETRGPGGCLALGLVFFNTHAEKTLSLLRLPQSQRELAVSGGVSFLSFCTFARALVCFDAVRPTARWLFFDGGPGEFLWRMLPAPGASGARDPVGVAVAFGAILKGAISALGIRFAGSFNAEALGLLCGVAEALLPGIARSRAPFPHRPPPVCVGDLLPPGERRELRRAHLALDLRLQSDLVATALLSAALVSAGAASNRLIRLIGAASACFNCGLVDPASVLHAVDRADLLHGRKRPTFGPGYGFHLRLCQAMGIAALGDGYKTVSASEPQRVALLALACGPFLPPIMPNDNTLFFQPLAHLVYCAAERSFLQATDAAGAEIAGVRCAFEQRVGSTSFATTIALPSAVPDWRTVCRVEISGPVHRMTITERAEIKALFTGDTPLVLSRSVCIDDAINEPISAEVGWKDVVEAADEAGEVFDDGFATVVARCAALISAINNRP
eukprot:gnl/Chilomastix_cuspidata/5301.p1 GENE.gnl/Chilomastix_cuspidata/5301~~gnl/Chilomastix_cuspidata/5301.p1  ORF type:complete len:879 (+),score=324.69 gnl/Chilomastix_cuspidata/5301:38-2674(+)